MIFSFFFPMIFYAKVKIKINKYFNIFLNKKYSYKILCSYKSRFILILIICLKKQSYNIVKIYWLVYNKFYMLHGGKSSADSSTILKFRINGKIKCKLS
jgi:hypothetical protein